MRQVNWSVWLLVAHPEQSNWPELEKISLPVELIKLNFKNPSKEEEEEEEEVLLQLFNF